MELLSVKGLTFTYPRQPSVTEEPLPALSDVSFSIEQGEFIVLCGESGCGKTTLLRLLKRELAPHGEKSGEVRFMGKLQEDLTDQESACDIGYVLQNPESQTVTDKVWHELAFGLENMGIATSEIHRRVAEMACFFGIDEWFDKKTTDLSGGQKQLLNLASILVMRPKLLILDEPTSQLDPIAASEFIGTLGKINKELGLTILMTEHRLEDVFPIADRVFLMEGGRLLLTEPPAQAGHTMHHTGIAKKMLLGLPSAMRIYQSLDADDLDCPLSIRDGRKFLRDNYKNEIPSIPEETVPEPENKKERQAMRMKGICFRYERELPDVLVNVHMTLHKGEILSLLGGNGAGKTTLLHVIAGLLKPYKGKIEILGKRIDKYKDRELYVGNVALLPQNPQSVFIKMTVRDDYRELRHVMGYKKDEMEAVIDEMAEKLGIAHLMDRHPYDLSGGEQQKAAFGKILLQKPQILLLDEPTKGIDAWSKHQFAEILQELKSRDIAIMIVTHDVEFAAEVSDVCGMFFNHEITSLDTPRNFYSSNNFYTTAANRISRDFFERAVTCDDVVELCKMNGRNLPEAEDISQETAG